MDLSVIIVNYNTKRLTMDCIESVLRSETHYRYEIILVDNASVDGTAEAVAERFPAVRIIRNETNVGFAKANNQGIRISSGRYILLLNSDTVVEPRTLDVMIRFMDDAKQVGAAGCKLVLPNGKLDDACKRGFPTPKAAFYYAFGFSRLFPKQARFNQYKLTHLDPDAMHHVDCIVGAFMMVRRETVEQVGLLDETFFMYGEDIDWCYRIKQAGWDIVYYPATTVIHYKGASSRKKPWKIVYEFHRAMVLFHRKHLAKQYPWAVNAAVYAGIAVIFLASILKNAAKVLYNKS